MFLKMVIAIYVIFVKLFSQDNQGQGLILLSSRAPCCAGKAEYDLKTLLGKPSSN